MKQLILLAFLLSSAPAAFALNTAELTVQDTTVKVKKRIVVSFISKGQGIDNDSYEKIKKFIDKHPKNPKYDVKNTGKEGEKEIIISDKNLTKRDRKKLVKDINKLIEKKDLVTVKETEIRRIRSTF